MKIAVIGIGGVGGYYGGKLAKYCEVHDYIEVTFIARGKHLERIKRDGLKLVTDDEGTLLCRPHSAVEDPAQCGIFDMILFCVKGYDLEESAKLFEKNIGEDTVAISLLNGVDNPEKISAVHPDLTVLNGCVYLSAFIEEPGTVRKASGPGTLFYGDEEGKFKDWPGMDMVFKEAGIKAQYRDDIQNAVWEKFIFICPIASVTSVTGRSFGEVLAQDNSRELLEGLLKELGEVARVQGINLPDDFIQASIKKVGNFPHDTKSSLQMDFEKGKKTEIESFTGYVVRQAKKSGMEVPLHQMVYSKLLDKKS